MRESVSPEGASYKAPADPQADREGLTDSAGSKSIFSVVSCVRECASELLYIVYSLVKLLTL